MSFAGRLVSDASGWRAPRAAARGLGATPPGCTAWTPAIARRPKIAASSPRAIVCRKDDRPGCW